jgi:membrane protein YqaA with SNARE-associated domain
MVGCAKAFSLSEEQGRAAVLISVLPISPPVFALAGYYDCGLAEAVTNVVLGKLLFFPAVLAWEAFMNAVDLFPVVIPAVNDICADASTT